MSTTRLLEDSLNCLIPPDAAASRSGCYGKTDKKKKKESIKLHSLLTHSRSTKIKEK